MRLQMRQYPGSLTPIYCICCDTSMLDWEPAAEPCPLVWTARHSKMNENGHILLELWCHRDLCMTNTYFECKDRHKVSWRHPRPDHWHQLDFIITTRTDMYNTLHMISFHSSNSNTYHTLVYNKVRLTPTKIHHSKIKCIPCINICRTGGP
jgi:hypothetical protein